MQSGRHFGYRGDVGALLRVMNDVQGLTLQGGSGTEPEPETGTVGTVFPETESGTGTAGTVFQEPKPETGTVPPC